jgi:hypothetical protein
MADDVIERDPRIADLLEEFAPLRLDAKADWDDALQRAERSSGRGKHRRLLFPVIAAAVLVVVGGATAAGIRIWKGPSNPAAIDTTQAESLVRYRLRSSLSVWKAGDTIALWRMPQPDGSVCVFTALASPRPSAPAPGADRPNLASGGFCSPSGTVAPPDKAMGVMPSASLEGGVYRWLVAGEVNSESGIVKLELRSSSGTLPLAFENDWFLGELPTSNSTTELATGGPYVLVGYDEHGVKVARLDLNEWLTGDRDAALPNLRRNGTS